MSERHFYAVVGSMYGDEGKGMAVDRLAHELKTLGRDPIVVRHNGGSQAGHTVVLPDGRRHVFHSMGSGTLAGARTHLADTFIFNPQMFLAEHRSLENNFSIRPEVTCGNALVSTFHDVLLNQIAESSRGSSRHGSCGLGIGETVARHVSGLEGTQLRLFDVARLSGSSLRKRLSFLAHDYFWRRLEELKIEQIPNKFVRLLRTWDPENEILLLRESLDKVRLQTDSSLGTEDAVIFEGAQGLLLDEHRGDFPHVTRSRTGLFNVVELLREAEIEEELRVYYMTRCYTSRHGAGPLKWENLVSDRGGWGGRVADPTNRPNEWQGTLRTAPLDLDQLGRSIWRDYEEAQDLRRIEGCPSSRITGHVWVTHMDCFDGQSQSFVLNGAHVKLNHDQFCDQIFGFFSTQPNFSYGPTREDVKKLAWSSLACTSSSRQLG